MPTPAEAAAILRARFGFGTPSPTPEDYQMPGDPGGERAAPDPTTSANILRGHFGMVSDPVDPNVVVGDPTGAIALAGNRGRLHDEFANRVSNDAFAANLGPQTGFEPGSPGKRFVSNLPVANLAADQDQMLNLEHTMRADPFTGSEETARIGGIQKALDTAATTMRPEIGDAADTLAKRNAFAEFLKNQSIEQGKKMGEYKAAASPEAYAAALTPIRAAGSAENQAVLDAAGRRTVEANAAKKGGVKYTAAEQQLIDKANEVQELGPKLMALMEHDLPGIDQDPTKYGSWFDKANASVGGFIYRQGKTQTANSDRIRQFTGYLEAAIPRMLNSGRLNQQQYEDLKLHAPQIGFSDGANYERIKTILHDILPSVLRGIDEGHGANPTETASGTPADPWASVPPPNQLHAYEINR